jgi:hypothetical protein
MKRFSNIHFILFEILIVSTSFFLNVKLFSMNNSNINKTELQSDSTNLKAIGLSVKNLPIVIQDNDSISNAISNIIKKNPIYIDKRKGIEYHMKILKPDSNIDYKILKVSPDPSIDYKIMIFDPRTKGSDIQTEELFRNYLRNQENQNKNKSK